MRVLLDTAILIDHLRGAAEAVEYLESLEQRPGCSEITRIEVVTGLRSAERAPAEQLFALIDWVPVDEPIAKRAGELGRRFRARHRGIDVADLAIAATADSLGIDLATPNVKHFPMFPGLEGAY